MGHRSAKDTAKLIEKVARGDRLLQDIKDPELRETVRLALRLHKDPYTGPDGKTRSRIRSRVLNGLHPREATMVDRVAVAFELFGRPTPYAMRALAVGLIVMAIGASTAVASAGTVADDGLYSVKITSEQMRLALATSPEDRALVHLSIAEHRLAEAIALATAGKEDPALVATSEYGEHIANAAAELAQVEALQPETATLVLQLQQRIDQHRSIAAAAVARFAEDHLRASGSAALSVLAARGSPLPDLGPAAAIAQDAADTADEAASVADRNGRGKTTGDGELTRNETIQVQNERASKEPAYMAARRAADEAKAAAKKAKHGSHGKSAIENYEESDDLEGVNSGDGGRQ